MGASVGTQAANPRHEVEIIGKARALVQAEPNISTEDVVKQLVEHSLGVEVDRALVDKVRELAATTLSNEKLWEEVRSVITRPPVTSGGGADASSVASGGGEDATSASAAADADIFQPRKINSRPRMSRSKEFLLEQQTLLWVNPDDDKHMGASAATVSMMSPEFKRPQSSKNVLYPPLPESAVRPLPRDVAGSFSCHGQSDVGKFKENQDRGVMCFPFNCDRNQHRALFIVADGHGEDGHNVSDFVAKTLVNELSSFSVDDDDLNFSSIRDCFLRTNAKLAHPGCPFDASKSGTTCVVALFRPTFVITASVGDSRAIVGRKVGPAPPRAKTPTLYKAFNLTVDHKPDCAEEKERIERAGGFVTQPEWSSSSRVWLDANCNWPGLAMARSIGDLCVKGIGVTAEPDVRRYDFEPNDAFVVMATDGIWEFLSSDDVVQIISLNLHSPKHTDKTNLAEICAMEVIKCAIKQWKVHEDGYRDDITCSVILLPWDKNLQDDATA